MPTALVTGGAGFVGSAVVRALAASGRKVRVLVRRTTNLENLEGVDAELRYGDVRDPVSVLQACRGADEVFHTAALFRYGGDPKELFAVNVEGTRAVIRAAVEAGVRRIVHTSSIAAVGARTDGTPVDETWTWNWAGFDEPYTESKREAELVALSEARKGAPVVVVNPSGPVGAGDRGPTGQLIRAYASGFLRVWLDQWINLVDVDAVAQGHLLAAEKGQVGERYLLTGENLHGKELARMVLAKAGKSGPFFKAPEAAGLLTALAGSGMARLGKTAPATMALWRMRHFKLVYDNGKARRALGWDPGSVPDAVDKAIAWFRQKGMLGLFPRRARTRP